MTFKPVRKAILPVAGLGTRFLPATKAMPKEMLTVGDRPLIQHVVEEAREAGIEEFIFITGRNKEMLEQHFGFLPELEQTLERRGKKELLAKVREATIPEGKLFTARQDHPLGLGHAVWCGAQLVGNEPFAVLLPDVLTHGASKGCLAQMMDIYREKGGNIIAVEDVPRERTDQYGIVDTGGDNGDVAPVKALVEKPAPDKAPSTLSVTGRYILQPEIFTHLAAHEKGAGGEIQLTDGMAKLIGSQPFHTLRFEGKSYDCGMRLGFIEANIAYGLADKDIGAKVKDLVTRHAK